MTEPMTDWVDALEADAPDVVAVWRAMGGVMDPAAAGLGDALRYRRELRHRAGEGSAARALAQNEAVGEALREVLLSMPDALLRAPGGEGDWNVAQAFAHTTGSRRWLAKAGALAASGAWPDEAPVVRPGIPGAADASRDELLALLDKSQRSIAESAAAIAGHETQPCPLEHPLVGRLRCGEWLLFAAVHDVMHLEQLHRLRDGEAAA